MATLSFQDPLSGGCGAWQELRLWQELGLWRELGLWQGQRWSAAES
jgi:hypothetical protein